MASIRCAHCKETHSSVAEVRDCAAAQKRAKTAASAGEAHRTVRAWSEGNRTREPAAEGFYRKDGEYYKVQVAHYGSGHRYAKMAQKEFGSDRVAWVYTRGIVYDLTEEDKVTQEQAAEFGALYGRCIRCGRVLTAEESIERAMGPVCSGKMGW